MSTTLLDCPAGPPQIVDDATRREFLTGLTAAGLLAACGVDSGDGGDGAAVAGFPRDVEHGGGTARLERPPERVFLGTSRSALDAMLILDAPPAVVAIGGSEALSPWVLDAGGGDIPSTAAGAGEVDLELLAGERVDLSLVPPYLAEGGALSGLGPIVTIPDFTTVPDELVLVGRVLGRDADAADLVADRAAAIGAWETPRRPDGITIFFAIPGGGVFTYSSRSGGGGAMALLLDDLGLTVTSRAPAGEFGVELSGERLADLDDELVLAVAPYPGDASALDDVEASPLFATVPAVQDGRYVRLDTEGSQAVLFGGTNLGLTVALDALTRALTP